MVFRLYCVLYRTETFLIDVKCSFPRVNRLFSYFPKPPTLKNDEIKDSTPLGPPTTLVLLYEMEKTSSVDIH